METILVTKSIFLWIIILKCLISYWPRIITVYTFIIRAIEYNHVLMLLFQLL